MLAIGAFAAIKEIHYEAMSLQLCYKCQEAVERSKRTQSSLSTPRIPKPVERANRVLMFMENYPDKKDVNQAGLDALINYARNGNLLLLLLKVYNLFT